MAKWAAAVSILALWKVDLPSGSLCSSGTKYPRSTASLILLLFLASPFFNPYLAIGTPIKNAERKPKIAYVNATISALSNP